MIITCEACSTSFNLDDKMIKPTGSKVRCSVCATVFTAFPQQDDEPVHAVATHGLDAHALESEIFETVVSPTGNGARLEQNDSAATILASLDDDDLDLDVSVEDAGEEGNATILADLDDDLDLSLDSESDGSATIIADLDQDDFDLDGPDASSGVLTDKATVLAEMNDDALDLDFSMDGDSDDHSPAAGPSAAGDPDGALFLDDADAGRTRPGDSLPDLEDDLDLSGLEGLLKDEDDAVKNVTDASRDKQKDIELALDPSDDAPGAADDAADLESSLEAIELDLENGAGQASTDADGADGDDANIDLSEIEKMLEEPETGAASGFSSVPDQDLDLDIEASLETERWMTDAAGGNDQVIKDEQLDLSELEQVLDDFEGDAPDDDSDDRELELDLSEDQAAALPDDTDQIDDELAFNLPDFDNNRVEKASSEPEDRDLDEMSLEFEVEGEQPGQQRAQDMDPRERPPARHEAPEKPERTSRPPVVAAPVTPVRLEPATKGMSKSLIFILIVVLLGSAGYGTYYLLNHYNVEIPFLSDYLKPKVDDPGNIKMSTTDINSRFVDNAAVGKLFVITGKVKNGYPDNRGMIALLGKIFSTGKVLMQEEKVYAGNIMSDLELANLDWDAIKARLSNRLGDNRSNVKIEPGDSIPFMVVFSGLPDDLEEFTIEVIESTSLK
jgi:predicted Zn finger-like uncharacterized protein